MILKFLKNKNSPSLEKGATSRQKGHFHNCCPFFFIFSLHPLAAALMDCQRTWSLFLFLAPSFSFFSPPLSAGVENLLQISFFLPLRTEKRLCPCRVHSLSLLLAHSLSHTHTHTHTHKHIQVVSTFAYLSSTWMDLLLFPPDSEYWWSLSLCYTPTCTHKHLISSLHFPFDTSLSAYPFISSMSEVFTRRFYLGEVQLSLFPIMFPVDYSILQHHIGVIIWYISKWSNRKDCM